MKTADLIADGVVGAAAAFAATKAMKLPAQKTYDWMPDDAREAEDAARPELGAPYRVATARASARVLGVDPGQATLDRVGTAVNYLTGALWSPVYIGLRRAAGLRPLPAGLALGAIQSLVQDEVITPLIGASAPNPEYPPVSHVRGFVNHLAYGLVVAGFAEAAWGLLGRRP